MMTITESSRLLHVLHEEALEAERKDALASTIRVVDLLLSHSETIDEFSAMWACTKAMYEELTA